MNDSVSENSVSIVPNSSMASGPSMVKKSYSLGSKRKAKHVKRKLFVTSRSV